MSKRCKQNHILDSGSIRGSVLMLWGRSMRNRVLKGEQKALKGEKKEKKGTKKEERGA